MKCTPFLLICTTIAPAYAEEDKPRSIQVTGNAEVRVTPDEVVLSLGVQTRDLNLLSCKDEIGEVVKKVIKALEKLEVKPEKLQTDYLDIHPVYKSSDASLRDFDGYVCRQSIIAKIDDVGLADVALAAALQAGVNVVQGVDFRTTKLREHRDKARSMAIKAAKEKAEALAAELDQKIGEPLSISEGSNNWYYWGGSRWWGGWGGGYSSWASQNVSYTPASTGQADDAAMVPGTISVSAAITVSFALEAK